MGVANSRAVIVLVFIVVLASYSKPTLVDAKSKLWCKAICELKCGGIFEAVHCFDQCYDHCRSEKAKASPVDICNYGCVMTSCVDSLDLKSKRSCADSCSQSCKASFIRA